MREKLLIALSVGTLLGVAGVAQADTEISFSATIGLSPTNWVDSVSIPKWDPDGPLFAAVPDNAVLAKVTIKLEGHVEGDAKFESLDASPATVTGELSAAIALFRPDNSILLVVTPLANFSENVGAYDGVLDFGGTSGRTFAGLSQDVDDTGMSPPGGDLPLFDNGALNEMIVLPVVAAGTSTASGAGNLVAQFATNASAKVTVTYTYIPEPASTTLGFLGLGALGLVRRRLFA